MLCFDLRNIHAGRPWRALSPLWFPTEGLLATGFMRDNFTLKMEMIW